MICRWICFFWCVRMLRCHRAACQGARELLITWSKSIWPPGLVEQSRPGVGKILLGLVTNPSSMYPRVVSMVCKDQSAVRDISVSKHRVESVILQCTVATYVPQLRERSLSQVSCPKQRVVTVFCCLHRENCGLFHLSHHSKCFCILTKTVKSPNQRESSSTINKSLTSDREEPSSS